MLVITLSVIAFLAGPVLYRLARSGRSALDALDGFVFVIVGGLVLLEFAPRAFAAAGAMGLAAVLAGFGALALAERVSTRSIDRALWPLAVVAFAFHEFVDGLALAGWQVGDHSDALLPTAIVLHRVPIGIALWWLVAPTAGVRKAALALALVAAATVAGYVSGATLVAHLSAPATGVVQGFIAGAFLHALLHRPGHEETPEPTWDLAAGVGGLLGVALLGALHETTTPRMALEGHLTAGATFLTLALIIAPFLVIAYLVEWLAPRPSAYLSAEALLASVPLLGAAFTAVRIVTGILFSMLFRRVLQREATPSGTPWILAGLGVACLIEPLFDPQWFSVAPPVVWMAVAALAGLPAYVSAGAATPIVVVLLHKGMPAGAGLAFLLTAPLPMAALFALRGARGLLMAGAAAAMAFVAGVALDSLVSISPFPLHQAAETAPGPVTGASLMALVVLVALGILRQGPRRYVAQVFRRH